MQDKSLRTLISERIGELESEVIKQVNKIDDFKRQNEERASAFFDQMLCEKLKTLDATRLILNDNYLLLKEIKNTESITWQ